MIIESEVLLRVNHLVTSFMIEGQTLHAVNDVSFEINRGQTLGLVGESGCGKSVTSLSIMRLLPRPAATIESGSIEFNQKDILKFSEEEMQHLRGNDISMIFQEPMTALNPVMTIGYQLSEVFIYHQSLKSKQAREKSIALLRGVGIPLPEQRFDEYPHQLSGGMRQRVMIAMALACEPKLLIADEPTTALDVTIQAQILELVKELQSELKMSILFITHDLGVIAETCDELAVMYAGKIVEKGSVFEVFKSPKHPYTVGLLHSKVTLATEKNQKLAAISGTVPSLFDLPQGCAYQGRCPRVIDRCRVEIPPLEEKQLHHYSACFNPP